MNKISHNCWLWQNKNYITLHISGTYNYLIATFVHISHSPLGFWIFQVFSIDIGLVFVEHFKISPLFKTTNNFSEKKKWYVICHHLINKFFFQFTSVSFPDNQRKITLDTTLSIMDNWGKLQKSSPCYLITKEKFNYFL